MRALQVIFMLGRASVDLIANKAHDHIGCGRSDDKHK